jgi:hypothetical protein
MHLVLSRCVSHFQLLEYRPSSHSPRSELSIRCLDDKGRGAAGAKILRSTEGQLLHSEQKLGC